MASHNVHVVTCVVEPQAVVGRGQRAEVVHPNVMRCFELHATLGCASILGARVHHALMMILVYRGDQNRRNRSLDVAMFRQAARLLATSVKGGSRGMATKSAEEMWAPIFPKAPTPTSEQTARNVRKEMVGFLLLGPIGGGLMIYDFIYGLEEHSDNVIPPYPW